MIGLELVMGGLLELASIGSCAKQKVPPVMAAPLVSTATYDLTKSRDELQGFEIDTVSPYGPSHRAKIGGLMSGEIRVESRIRFMQEKYPARGAGCVHIDSIDLIVHVKPTIYVAREFAKGTCQHNAILAHEKKHIEIDSAIAKKHAADLKELINSYLRQKGYSYGPYPIETLVKAQERLQSELQAVIERSNQAMTDSRRRQQQQLDSLEEYQRVAAQCRGGLKLPDEKPRQPRGSVSRRQHYNQ